MKNGCDALLNELQNARDAFSTPKEASETIQKDLYSVVRGDQDELVLRFKVASAIAITTLTKISRRHIDV